MASSDRHPTHHLTASLRVGESVASDILQFSAPVPLHLRIRAGDLAFCALLVNAEPSDHLIDLIDTSRSTADPETMLDLSLALELTTQSNGFEAVLENFPVNSGTQLLYDTYHTYSRIMSGDVAAISHADNNFSKRAGDCIYSGGIQIDGGGPDNAHTIDYRLATILHSHNLPASTIHRLPKED